MKMYEYQYPLMFIMHTNIYCEEKDKFTMKKGTLSLILRTRDTLKSTIFWNMIPCCPAGVHQFLQVCTASVCWWLVLLFDPELLDYTDYVAVYSVNRHSRTGVLEVEKNIRSMQVYLEESGSEIAPKNVNCVF
jgi:hypothetical protein